MNVTRRWAVAVAAVVIAFGAARPAQGFLSDLAGHWAGGVVSALGARGIVSGDLAGRFNPEGLLSRAEMAKLIVTGLGYGQEAQLLSRYDSRFQDIPPSHWAKGFIESLAEAGVTTGYGDGSFGPADTVTRAQMATFLVRAAGLADEARARQFATTTYQDDAQIPNWARGAVHVAQTYGLMTGFEDRTFRPMTPITRAEGSVALFRLMAYRGEAFHLTGTLVRADQAARLVVLRDEAGRERTVTMRQEAFFFRGGLRVQPFQIRPLDQVWVVLSPEGEGLFIEARYNDLLGSEATLQGRTLTARVGGGERRSFTVQPGALVFVNGRPASLPAVAGADQVYLSMDRVTGEVRSVDATKGLRLGHFVSFDPSRSTLNFREGTVLGQAQWASSTIIFLNGDRVGPTMLRLGDAIQIEINADGLVTYLQATR